MTDTPRPIQITPSQASALLPAVGQPLLCGALAQFGQTLLAADDPRPVRPLLEVLQPESLDALLLGIYGPQLLAEHRPVLVSQWSKYYFMQVIPPVVAAGLVHGWHWPLLLDQVALALDERGLPAGVRFGESGTVVEVQGFAGLIEENMRPVIAALSAYGGVPSAVLWGNAGDYLEACLLRLSGLTDQSLEDGHALLRKKLLADGRPNPLFNAVSYVGEPPRRQRRTCCLSYQVEWVGRCEHCPVAVRQARPPDSANAHRAG